MIKHILLMLGFFVIWMFITMCALLVVAYIIHLIGLSSTYATGILMVLLVLTWIFSAMIIECFLESKLWQSN